MIKNIVFDMGNVLLEYNPERYIKTVTTDEVAAGSVLEELFHSDEWRMLDAGAITEDEAVTRVCARIPQYAGIVEKALVNWHNDLTPIEGMPEIVSELKKRGYKIYLLSNTSMYFYNFKDRVDMFRLFDGFIISAKEKLVKPDILIFERLCARYHIKANECLFIDDLQTNIDSCEKAGFHGHLFLGEEDLHEYLQSIDILQKT